LYNYKGLTEVVGRVGNVLKDGNDRQPQPEIYFPVNPTRGMQRAVNIVVRTTGNAAPSAGTIGQMILEAEPTATLDRVEPLAVTVAASFGQPRLGATVFVTIAL